MPLLLAAIAVVALYLAYRHLMTSAPLVRALAGVEGTEPSVAAAAMLYAVANTEATVTAADERLIMALLLKNTGVSQSEAQNCLKLGRRARYLSGDLTAQLHQLKAPIERHLTTDQKRQLIGMLREIAGVRAERLGPVRDGIGRLSATIIDS